MSSLSVCLKRIGAGKHEETILRAMAADYQRDGYEAHAAAVNAVKDYIRELEEERADILRQVKEAGGEVDEKIAAGTPLPQEAEKTLENAPKQTIIEGEAQAPTQEVEDESVEPEGTGRARTVEPADREPGERPDVRGTAGLAAGQPAPARGEAVPGEPGQAEGGAGEQPATGEPGAAAAETEGGGPRPGRGKGVRPDRGAGGRTGAILESPEAAAGRRAREDSKRSAELAPENRNHVIEPGDEIVPPGDEGKIKANIRAIELVKRLTAENRNPSPEEKKVLAQYTGWGAFAQKIFNDEYTKALDRIIDRGMAADRILYGSTLEKYQNWERKYGRKLHPKLGGALTEEEWEAAKASTLNAHYTDRDVIDRMWSLVRRLGFKGGAVTEPAAGAGHFIGLMPQDLAGASRINAVELDSITGQILTKLYPQARVQVMGFEKARGIPDNSQDLVISNFPFGKFSVFDPKRPQYGKWSIHNYFFGRSIDAVRPGGLVVAITSHFTMDAVTNGETRAALAKKADFVGGIRLPYTAFKKNAGTEVVTDILVFRKKDATSYGLNQDFRVAEQVEVAPGKPPAFINEYFVKHPEMVMGKHAMTGSMRGADEYTVEPTGADLNAQIARAIEALPENIMSEGNAAAAVETEVKYATMKDIDGALVERDGEVYMVSEGKLVAPTLINDKGKESLALSSPARKARARQYLKIKDIHKRLIDRSNTTDATDAELDALRAELNRAYDDFVKKYGNVGEPGNSFLKRIDLEFPIVDALENEEVSIVADTVKSGPNKGQPVNRRVKTFTKADVFTKRTIYPFVEPETAGSIEEAATLSEVYRAGLDTGYIAKLTARSEEEVKAELVEKGMAFINPETGLLEAPDLYLSGNVKKKLKAAEAAAEDNPEYASNVKALSAVQPDPVDIEFIHFRLGTPWIPGEAISDFLKETMGVTATATYSKNSEQSSWHLAVEDGYATALNNETWGAGGRGGDDLVLSALNMKRPVITYTYEDENGSKRTARDDEATEAAQAKQEEIQEEFLRWARASEKWKDKLAEVYNEEKNGHVLRKTETPKIEHFPGANPHIKLRPLQKRFVARGLRESTIFAYGVGTGKTYSFISLAMEMRRVGTAKKPMIVVQNSTIGQYRKAFNQLYPGARVLIPDEKQRAARYRQRLLSQIATGDWDAVVVPHSFFDAIADDVDREIGFIREQIKMIEEAITDAEAEEGKKSFTVKDLEALKKRKEDRIEKALNRRKDKALNFEKMGIDALLVDEAHAYKRSEFFTKMQRVKGIDQGASQRSTSLLMKSRYVQEKTGGKNVILATGTPISNTTAELWTIIRYVRPDLLEDYGVDLFDDFAATFGQTQTALEETETGTYREVERFNKYVNGTELLTMWRTAADVQLTRDAGLRLPDVAGGKPEFVTVERTPSLNRFIDELRAAREAWDHLTGKEKRESRHVPVVLFGLAKKAAVDMRLVSASYEDHPDSKLNKVVEKVHEIWQGTSGNRSTQVVFLDSQNDSTKTFNSHEDLRQKLIDKGIPKSEVALVTDAKGDSAREALFDRVRSGAVRVIIGSSQKLGVGVNMQDLLIAAHHVDVPPRPMDIEQRNGRIVREGNTNPKVRIFNYGVRATLDSVMYDRLTKKQRFIDQMLVGDIESREFDDPLSEEQASLAEMMAAFSGNPLVFEKTDVELKAKKLRRAKLRWEHEVSMARRNTERTQARIEETEKTLEDAEKTAAELEKTVPGGKLKEFTLNGKPAERKDVNEALAAFVAAENAKHPKQLIGKKEWKEYVNNVTPAHIQFTAHGQRVQVGVRPDYGVDWDAWNNKKEEKWNLRDAPDIAVGFGRKGDDFLIKRSVNTIGGLMSSLENSIDGIFKRPAELKEHIKKEQADLAEYEKISKSPFKQTDELAATEQRLAEIERELQALPSLVNRAVADEGNAIRNLLNFANIEREADEEGGSAKAEVGIEGGADATAEEAPTPKAEFYIFTNQGFKPVPHARPAKIVTWAETFTHNIPGEEFSWTVSEATTGLAIESRAGTRKQVIEAAKEKLERTGESEFKKLVAAAEKVPEDLRAVAKQHFELAKPAGKIAGVDIPLEDEYRAAVQDAIKESPPKPNEAALAGDTDRGGELYSLAGREASEFEKFQRVMAADPIRIETPPISKETAEQAYRAIKSVVNRHDGRKISFVMETFDKIAGHKNREVILRAVPQLDSITESAVPIYPELERKPHLRTNVLQYHNYLNRIELDGENYFARLTVREIKDARNELHNVFISDIQITRTGEGDDISALSSTASNFPESGSDKMLNQWLGKVKAEATKYDLRPQAARRVDLRDVPLEMLRKHYRGQSVERDEKSGGIWIRTQGGRSAYVHVVDHISADSAAVEMYYGRKPDPNVKVTARGSYLTGRGEMKLVRDAGTNEYTIAHEGEHWLEDSGIITKNEVLAMRSKIRFDANNGKWTPVNKQDIGGPEDRAHWLARELLNRKEHRGTLRGMLDLVRDIIDSVVSLFSVTARGVVRKVESGKIYERSGEGRLGIEQNQLFEGEKGIAARTPLPQGQEYDIVDDVLPAGVADRYRDAQGAGKPKLLAVIREKAKMTAATFTPGRMFPKMPNRYFGRENVLLREFMEAGDYGRARAIMELKDILDPKNLKAEDYKLFGLKLVLDDMQKDMEPGGVLEDWQDMVASQGEIAFGFQSKDEVDDALARVDAALARQPAAAAAIARRQQAIGDLRKQLVKEKMLPEQVLNDERYFHHQVLEYANAKRFAGVDQKAGEVRVRKAGWQYARTGSIKDYNTKYLESEFEVLAQGFERLARKQVLDEIGEHANILSELKSKAKRDNLSNYYEVKAAQLRQLMPEITAADMRQPQNDPLLPYRQKIAMGLGQISKLAERGRLDPGPFENVVEALAERDASDTVGFDPDGSLFRYLGWLANTDGEGAAQARMIFKAIGDRNREIKETLGRRLKTWRDVMKERAPRAGSTGWAEWVPRPGTAWYMTNSINDQILGEVLAGNRQLEASDVRPVLARGADVRWVIPAELAEVMDGADFQRSPKDNVVSQAAEATMNMWKRWILINPLRVIKYNLNNTSGDLDITLAYDPRILRYAGRAIKDLWAYHYNKNMTPELKEEFRTALKHGVIGGITAHDIPDIGKMADFRQLERAMGARDNVAIDLIQRFWHGSKNFTQFRENVLRLAAFRYFKERVAAGERVYGASLPNKVNAIDDTEIDRKAGLLARELIGDYGGLSKGGRWLRRKLIPFYSWCVPDHTEILTRRGWKHHTELVIGEEVLTYNMKERTTEWQPAQDKAVFPFDGDLVTIQNAWGFKYQFTEDHRVVVIEKYKDQRKFIFAKDLKTHQHIPTVAPHEFVGQSVLSVTDAALLGWLVTDGYFRVRKHSPKSFEAMLYQKKEADVENIRRDFSDYISTEAVHRGTGVICFRLKSEKLKAIRAVFKSKDDLPGIVTRLGLNECQAMYDAMLAAEGTSVNSLVAFPQNAGPVLDAFQILCYMLGKAGHIRPKNCGEGKDKCYSLYVKKRDKIQLNKWENTREHYTGTVWCPKTANGTWVMRQNGQVMITGNSEINAPRYWRLMRNISIEGEPAGRRVALLGAVAGKKAAFLGAKAFMLYGAIALWNALVFPDEEEELGEEGRRQMHLILGRRADGSIMTLRLQGALSDALSWFNLHDFPEDMRDLVNGKQTVYQWLGQSAREPVNKMLQGIRPDIKGFGELIGGKTIYPDFARPRPIRDRGEYVARMLSLEGFYRRAAGRPMKEGTVAGQVWEDVLRTFSYSANPGETAYYGAREMVGRFLEDRNIERPFHEPTDRSNALYWYKTAIKYGDAKAAERYLNKYKDLGGTMKGLKISVDRAHPLAALPNKYRTKFLNELSQEDRETVKRASRWYKETFKR